jgi:hypothetical protein
MVAAARDRFTNYQSPITAMARKPGNAFEIALEKWRRGEDISWGELFAAWLKTPMAPASSDTVRRVIRKVEWIL